MERQFIFDAKKGQLSIVKFTPSLHFHFRWRKHKGKEYARLTIKSISNRQEAVVPSPPAPPAVVPRPPAVFARPPAPPAVIARPPAPPAVSPRPSAPPAGVPRPPSPPAVSQRPVLR